MLLNPSLDFVRGTRSKFDNGSGCIEISSRHRSFHAAESYHYDFYLPSDRLGRHSFHPTTRFLTLDFPRDTSRNLAEFSSNDRAFRTLVDIINRRVSRSDGRSRRILLFSSVCSSHFRESIDRNAITVIAAI